MATVDLENTRQKKTAVTTGEVITKKPTESQKFWGSFIQEDFPSVRDYILSEVIIPKLKELFESAVTDSLSMFLWGNAKRNRKKNTNASRISYNLFGDDDFDDRRNRRTSEGPVYTHLVFKNREDAIAVLDTMGILLETYGVVSILDLYDIANVEDDLKNTYQKYGWKSITGAKVVRDGPDGWWLKLPNPKPLN